MQYRGVSRFLRGNAAAAFLLPLGIMLLLIISSSRGLIRKDRKELWGIDFLRPATSLTQIVPQYIRYSVDSAPGDREYVRQYAGKLLGDLMHKYEANFGRGAGLVSPQALLESCGRISGGTTQDEVLETYKQFMPDLYQMIVYIGDISGLVTDSELEDAYLVAAAVHELPQAQERLVVINNLFRALTNGMNQYLQREYARALRGEAIEDVKPGKRFKRINAIGAQGEDFYYGIECYKQSTDSQFFEGWFENSLLKEIPKGCTAILDNAGFHNKCRLRKLARRKIRLLFLPPYSPDYNPIEKAWSNMKRFIRSNKQSYKSIEDAIYDYFNVSVS